MKHFFIDSENVGDFWIPLLTLPAEDTELIVFYTKNSPHMSYESLFRLKESDRKVTFVKCYEGTNALDFQLCSELGFRLCSDEGDEFIIVTNDTGYDAAVKYWRHKKYPVKRITGKEAKAVERLVPKAERRADEKKDLIRKLNQEQEPEEGAPEAVSEVPETPAEQEAPAISEMTEAPAEPDTAEAAAEPDAAEAEDETAEQDAADLPEAEDEPAEQDAQETAAEPDAVEAEEAPAEPEVPAEPEAQLDQAEAAEETAEEYAPAAEAILEEEPAQYGEEEDDLEDDINEFAIVPDEEELTVIISCIGQDNLAELHNQLIQFYGEGGKKIYQSIKNGSLKLPVQDWDKQEKFLYYCALIVRHSDLEEEYCTEEAIFALAGFLCAADSKRRNLNSLRYALLKKLGKDLGRRYYSLVKPYVKVMNQM